MEFGRQPRTARNGRAQRRPLKPIMFCTADSLSSAIWSCSRATSAQLSHSFLDFPLTFTVTSSSLSSPQPLHVAMPKMLAKSARHLNSRAQAPNLRTDALERPALDCTHGTFFARASCLHRRDRPIPLWHHNTARVQLDSTGGLRFAHAASSD